MQSRKSWKEPCKLIDKHKFMLPEMVKSKFCKLVFRIVCFMCWRHSMTKVSCVGLRRRNCRRIRRSAAKFDGCLSMETKRVRGKLPTLSVKLAAFASFKTE